MRKRISICIMFMLFINTSFAFSATTTSSDIPDSTEIESIGNSMLSVPSLMNNEVYSTNRDILYSTSSNNEVKNLKTKIIKQLIKVIKNHKKTAVSVVKKYGGKEASRVFSKHFSKVCKELDKLLKYEDLALSTLEHAIYRGLVNGGVKKSTATTAAHALIVGVDILLTLIP